MTTENNAVIIALIIAGAIALFMVGVATGRLLMLRKLSNEMKSRPSEFFLN